MSILKELNELAAKYSEDYEKEATIEGAIDAVDKSLESALGALEGEIEDLQDLAYGDGTVAEPAEGSALDRIDDLENATEDLQEALYGEGGTPVAPAEGSIADRIGDLEAAGVLIVGATQSTEGGETVYTLDKTWQEIYDAPYAVLVQEQSQGGGGEVAATTNRVYAPVVAMNNVVANSYAVTFFTRTELITFYATGADGYPAMNPVSEQN